jgi:hypothetical protein
MSKYLLILDGNIEAEFATENEAEEEAHKQMGQERLNAQRDGEWRDDLDILIVEIRKRWSVGELDPDENGMVFHDIVEERDVGGTPT